LAHQAEVYEVLTDFLVKVHIGVDACSAQRMGTPLSARKTTGTDSKPAALSEPWLPVLRAVRRIYS
jgi:hypothetical protein